MRWLKQQNKHTAKIIKDNNTAKKKTELQIKQNCDNILRIIEALISVLLFNFNLTRTDAHSLKSSLK